ncbi:Uncharacterized protein APZ42_024335 [Daphnia magna]|uniref:Uncharacterized protein n=1 Tax=Daphnia magna TaxID=35525 RepID=A0A164UNH5_9CRUS|nr:Uncharacterized protein APZ42_024335 [Daphnia magna]
MPEFNRLQSGLKTRDYRPCLKSVGIRMAFALIVKMQNSRTEQVETARFGSQEDPSIPFEVERVNITRIYGLGKFTSPRAETIFFTLHARLLGPSTHLPRPGFSSCY